MRLALQSWWVVASLCLPATLAGQGTPDLLIEWSGGTARLEAAQLAALPRDTASFAFHGGQRHRFSGPRLLAVLRAAGVPVDSLRGRGLVQYVVAEARDGYRTLFSIGELLADLGNTPVIVADTMDGAALPAEDGPFRLIVPADRRPARSARQVTRIHVASPSP